MTGTPDSSTIGMAFDIAPHTTAARSTAASA
jgi:hypothetical protein